MEVETNAEDAAASKSKAEGLPPQLAVGATWSSQPSLPGEMSQSVIWGPRWYRYRKDFPKRSTLLLQLGVYHVVLALLHLTLGVQMLLNVQDLHLVVLKIWYPFWGAASFLLSGSLVILMHRLSLELAVTCIITNAVSFLFALAGLVVIVKDLFLENPFQSPIWRPYPNSTIFIQRLELALLCFTFLELFLPTSLATITLMELRLPYKGDNSSPIPDTPLQSLGASLPPPPSYEESVNSGFEGEMAPVSVEPTAPSLEEVMVPSLEEDYIHQKKKR